jgi:uncharacterized protein YceH (UPF0502 family)
MEMAAGEWGLTGEEARVLGSLVEKEIATPEYYPLSLNALVNACNQKTSRHPVMELDEEAVREALAGLKDKGLAGMARGTEGRVPKYEHHLGEIFNLRRGEMATLCVLLLRGPQTSGELRGRTERLHMFGGLDEVQAVVQRLMEREPALVRAMPREPGTKETRYRELLSAFAESASGEGAEAGLEVRGGGGRLTDLEAELRDLRERVEELERRIGAR